MTSRDTLTGFLRATLTTTRTRIEEGDALPADAIKMATAQKFKGCERPYSIVVRTKAMDDARFDTACTRARLGLAIIDVKS